MVVLMNCSKDIFLARMKVWKKNECWNVPLLPGGRHVSMDELNEF